MNHARTQNGRHSRVKNKKTTKAHVMLITQRVDFSVCLLRCGEWMCLKSCLLQTTNNVKTNVAV